ncbi:hypothetical protein LC040_02510 [Bacillus tianshenii]|nr:hypothetical protein LC040_02510 [Bacillus tianshenii]
MSINVGDMIFQLFNFLILLAIPLLIVYGVRRIRKERQISREQMERLTETVERMEKRMEEWQKKNDKKE